MADRSPLRTTAALLAMLLLATGVFADVPEARAQTKTTRLISLSVDGEAGDGQSPPSLNDRGPHIAVSADGRYVAFASDAANLLGAGRDENQVTDVFRYDRQTGELIMVSRGQQDGEPTYGNGPSGAVQIDISADGNLVVFDSLASNLTDDGVNPDQRHIYVRDVRNQYTVLASTDGEIHRTGTTASISSNGGFVAFSDDDLFTPVYRVELIFDPSGALIGAGALTEVVAHGMSPSISGDGRFVAFTTYDDLDPRDEERGGDQSDVYLWDANFRDSVQLISLTADMQRSGDGPSYTRGPRAVSDDGRIVAFWSEASDLLNDVSVPRGGVGYVRVRSGEFPFTEALPFTPEGEIRNSGYPQLSRDGAFATFTSNQGDLVEPPQGDQHHVYVRDLIVRDDNQHVITLASQSTSGEPADSDSGDAVLNGDGSVIAFGSAAMNLDTDRNDFNDVFVRADSDEQTIEGLSLTVAPVEGSPGITEVDLSGVDISALPLVPGELETTPLRSTPLRSTPLRSTPLRSTPLRSTPLRSTPLRSTPLRSTPLRSTPLRSTNLPPIPLSTVPLLADGGWTAILEGPPATPYAGLPLQSVTLQQVLNLPEGLYPQVDGLSYEDIDLASTPLGEVSLQVFLLGGPSLDALSSTTDWCAELAARGFDCVLHGIAEASSTLVDLAFAGGPVDDLTFLPDLSVAAAELDGSPAAAYDVASVDVDATSLGALPISAVPSGIVDCTLSVFDCTDPGATLGGAVAAGAILDAPTAVLGRILEVDALVGDLTLGDVVRMLVDPAKLSYDDVPLVPLLLGEEIEGQLQYTARATIDCTDTEQLTFKVALPAGFRYQPGSSSLSFDGEPAPDPGDPLFNEGYEPRDVDAPVLTWLQVGGEPPDNCTTSLAAPRTTVELSFRADPWVELGTHTSDVVLETASGSATVEDTAPFTVYDAHEPNDSAAQPTSIAAGELVLSHLGPGDQIDFFEVTDGGQPLERGSIVTAILAHLPADFDLRLDGPAIAPLRSTPLRSTPLRSTPIEDPGLSVDPRGQAIGPDLVEDVPRGESTLSQSAYRGLETEVVSMIVPPSLDGEPFTLAVSSYLGASSTSPYTLQVMVEPPPELSCVPQTAFDGAGAPGTLPPVSSLDPASRTLVLVNEQRFDALHGAGATQQVHDALAAAIPSGDQAGPFAVLPIDGDPAVRAAYSEWDDDPCEPERANDVVRAAVAVADTYTQALPELRFVVIVGDDNIVPSYRVPDLTTLANQRDYYPELVFGGLDNALSASAAYGYVLSDSAYTERDTIDWLDHELLVPDYAGGRLVESLPEILGTINRYATTKHLEIDSSLVTAYDFLTDGGQDTQDIIADRASDPSTARSLISDSWAKSELLTELGLAPDLTSMWAHYDHSRLLTAAGDAAPSPGDEIASSTEVLAAGLAQGTLFFTLGCNAGLNVPALVSVGASPEEAERLLDWAQATAQRGGAFFGNTGFGYGDDVVSAYGERLMTLFAQLLDGSMTIGQAAVEARHLYLQEAALDVYTDKVVAESTFYGLPFVRVGAAGVVGPTPDARPRPPAETGPVEPDPSSGQPSTAFTVEPTFTEVTTERGEYHVASIGGRNEPTLKALYRPVQPAITLNLPEPPAGMVPGDLLITGLSTTDLDQPDPVFVRPTVDLSEHEPEPVVYDVAYPVSMGYVTPSGNLLLSAGQFRRHMLGQGTQTLYTRIVGRVLYDVAGAPIDRPVFSTVEAHRFAGTNTTGFVVDVDQAEQVIVLYKTPTGEGWKRVDLEVWPDGTWTGAVTDEVSEYFVQAVRGAGVASARGKGLNFQPSEEPQECPTFDQVRAELDGLVAAGGITEGLEAKIRHALNTAQEWLQLPNKRGPALSHLRRAVHLLLWQADVVDKGKDNQGDPVGLRALALSIRNLMDCV